MLKLFFLDVTELNDDSLYEKYIGLMSDYRLKKINSYLNRSDRNLSLGVGILTDIFLRELNLTEKEMTYYENRYGKPYFKEIKDIFFNLSHSGIWAMAAFSDKEVGCDIEERRELKEDISSMVLSEEETEEDIIEVWTGKESYIKYLGTGLEKQMTDFSLKDTKSVKIKDLINNYSVAVCSPENKIDYCRIVKLSSLSQS